MRTATLAIFVALAGCQAESLELTLDPSAEALVDIDVAATVAPPPVDASLWGGNVVEGYNAEFRVMGANPFDTMWILWDFGNPTTGPCFPQLGGICSELTNPRLLGRVTTDANGDADFQVQIPGHVQPKRASFEAVGGGGANSYKTPAFMRYIQDDAPIGLNISGIGNPTPTGDDFTATSAEINGDTLFLDVEHSGGCAPHTYESWWNGAWMLSLPVQMNLDIVHDAHGDLCRALIFNTLALDLTDVRTSYGYGTPATIVIHAPDGNTVHYDIP